jgi:anthranilate phosphoribosyltransferase
MNILHGEHSTARNITLLNAGAAIYVSGIAQDLQKGIEKAATVVDNGQALKKLNELVKESHE